jgi:hypothetical protein
LRADLPINQLDTANGSIPHRSSRRGSRAVRFSACHNFGAEMSSEVQDAADKYRRWKELGIPKVEALAQSIIDLADRGKNMRTASMAEYLETQAAYERIDELAKLLQWARDLLAGPEDDYCDQAFTCADAIDDALDERVLA